MNVTITKIYNSSIFCSLLGKISLQNPLGLQLQCPTHAQGKGGRKEFQLLEYKLQNNQLLLRGGKSFCRGIGRNDSGIQTTVLKHLDNEVEKKSNIYTGLIQSTMIKTSLSQSSSLLRNTHNQLISFTFSLLLYTIIYNM